MKFETNDVHAQEWKYSDGFTHSIVFCGNYTKERMKQLQKVKIVPKQWSSQF